VIAVSTTIASSKKFKGLDMKLTGIETAQANQPIPRLK
jgi:hypothetical protein